MLTRISNKEIIYQFQQVLVNFCIVFVRSVVCWCIDREKPGFRPENMNKISLSRKSDRHVRWANIICHPAAKSLNFGITKLAGMHR